jgi:2-(1,2-epoxy-1,2-dihydrophenyl)acetyl-CoA isomerase
MEHIRIDRSDGVGTITIDRPARFNSFDVTTARDLRKAGLELARDEAVRAVVLRGTKGVFCSGADLKYIRAEATRADLGYLSPGAREVPRGYGEVFKQILEYLHSTISEIKRAPKPFIAAVDGIAAAGGLGIAMSCDVVVASERATFEYAYGRTALTGAESSTFFLPKLIGLRRALDLLFLNPRLDAATARSWGLVSAVFPTASFDDEVAALARRLAVGPTRSWAIAKRLMHVAAGADRLDGHLDAEAVELARIADGPDFAEGIDAFFAKRPPRFKGAEK